MLYQKISFKHSLPKGILKTCLEVDIPKVMGGYKDMLIN